MACSRNPPSWVGPRKNLGWTDGLYEGGLYEGDKFNTMLALVIAKEKGPLVGPFCSSVGLMGID